MNAAARPHDNTAELAWFKSSYSNNEGGDCVEVALGGAVHVRDSKLSPATGPILTVTPHAWRTFLKARG
ncbi:DUF397 domain-containing protein [Streptomyces sp. NPDC052225]|uniref:DUF397 domain-containing protein n=1 Tax=Streptomyces sp. NPDC052225 TaxID=3154949 RepID=UPI00342DD364